MVVILSEPALFAAGVEGGPILTQIRSVSKE